MQRIPGYDYSQPGFYCNTICVLHHRICFGNIRDQHMHLSPRGEVAQAIWNSLPARYPHLRPDAFICMPNHVHMIFELIELDGAQERKASWEIVEAYKALTTKSIRKLPGMPWFAWQVNSFESLLLNERRLNRARYYIDTNPQRWEQDKFYKPF